MVDLQIGLAIQLIFTFLWPLYYLLIEGRNARKENKSPRIPEGEPANEVRERSALYAQLPLMGTVNLVATIPTSLGAAYYSTGDKLSWTDFPGPLTYIVPGLLMVQLGGAWLGLWEDLEYGYRDVSARVATRPVPLSNEIQDHDLRLDVNRELGRPSFYSP